STTGHPEARPISGLATDETPYPAAISGRRRNRSASRPETALPTDAVPSATPSTSPTTDAGAPSVTVRNSGSTGYSSSDAASWKKLTQDRTITLRGSRRRAPIRVARDRGSGNG